MPTRLRLDGVDAFVAALRALPAHLADEARTVIIAATENTKQEITEAYPTRVGGELRSHMRTRYIDKGPLQTIGIVENTSHLSNWYEYGTQERHTKLGAFRGAMPPGHVFVPIVMRARRRMQDTLIELIVREGFVVG